MKKFLVFIIVCLAQFHLAYSSSFDVLKDWNLSDKFSQFNFNLHGVTFLNNKFYFTGIQSDSIVVVDTSGQIVSIHHMILTGTNRILDIMNDGTDIFLGISNRKIFKVDTATFSIIQTIQLPYFLLSPYAFSYDPSADGGNGGFWTGTLSPNEGLKLYNRNGVLIDSIASSTLGNLVVSGISVDTFTAGGPYIILSTRNGPQFNSFYWIHLPTKQLTSDRYDLDFDLDIPLSYSGKSDITNQLYNGSVQLISTSSLIYNPLASKTQMLVHELDLPLPPKLPPVNDDICNAIQIWPDSGYARSNNVYATSEPGEPKGACIPGQIDNSVWFYFTVDNSAYFLEHRDTTVFGYGQNIERALFKASNGCNGNLQEVACKNDLIPNGSKNIKLTKLQLGDTIYIQCDRSNGRSGFFSLGLFTIPSISRDFEYYNHGNFISVYDEEWNTSVNGNSGIFGKDATVSNAKSKSGQNSLHFYGNQMSNVFNIYDSTISAGAYLLGFELNIPPGGEASFSLQGSDTLGQREVYNMSFSTSGYLKISTKSDSFPFQNDQWLSIKNYIDLNQDSIQIWMDTILIDAFPYRYNGGESEIGDLLFEASNQNQNFNFFIDDMVFKNDSLIVIPNVFDLFNLIGPQENALINLNNFGGIDSVTFTWQKTNTFPSDSITYLLMIDDVNLNFTLPILQFQTSGNKKDTLFTISKQIIDSALSQLGVPANNMFYGKWTVLAKASNGQKYADNGARTINFRRALNTSISGNVLMDDIAIFPNPNSGLFYIIHNRNENIKYQILNMTGFKIQEGVLSKKTSVFKIDTVNSGVYFLNLISNDRFITKKIVIR